MVFQAVEPELMLKSYNEKKLFELEVQKDGFAGGTVTEDLADGTAQKQQ